MPTQNTNGINLEYDIEGQGPPLVLIHGSWAERQAWGFVVPDLARSFRVVSYDRRGHGESGGRPDSGDVHDDVADVAGLIEALELGPAHVVANSYGANVALRLAGAHPDLVGTMLCHEPPMLGVLEANPDLKPIADEERRKLAEVRQRLEGGDLAGASEYFVENVGLGPGMWAMLPPEGQDMFIRNAPTFLGELRDPDALDADISSLQRVTVPVVLTHGDQSPPFFAPIIDELFGLVPGVRRQLMSGAGHVPQLTHPGEYVVLIQDLLDQHP